MGYIFTLLSIISGNIKGYCGKKTSSYSADFSNAVFINFIRMIFCIILGFGFVVFESGFSSFKINLPVLLTSLMSGITTSLFVIFWLISVKKGAYMMLDVFLMLGIFVPITGCNIIFNEPIKLTQWIGLIILITAVLIMCSYNTSLKGKMSLSSVILLIACGASNGLTDLSQKLFTYYAKGVPASVFNFYTYVFSASVLFVFYLIFGLKQNTRQEEKTLLKNIFGYVLTMSVCLFLNSYFKTLAANYLTSAQLYPLSQGLSLVFSSVMSAVFFKEKITLKCIFGILLAFASLIIINVL